MLPPRWYKVISDLWGNKLRSLLVIASITVGLFAVGMITTMQAIILEDLETSYAAINPANIQFHTSPFGYELIEHIRQLDSVRQVEGAYNLTLRVRNASGDWESIDIKAIDDIEEMQINQVRPEQGVWPPKDRQIVIDRYKLPNLPVGVGGSILVELPSGKTREMEITGVVQDLSIGSTGQGGFFLTPVQGYITLETLEWLGFTEAMNTLYVTVDGNPNDLEYLRQVANQVSEKIENADRIVNNSAVRASNNHPNRIYVLAIASVLLLLGFFVMFLSAFLITNTLSALLNQQVNQIGVMKAIGGRQRQVMGIYMILILIFGVVAFAFALPLSSRAAYALLEFLASKINMVLQGYRIIPLAVILQLVIALIVPQVAGFIPILRGTRISVVEAFSGFPQSSHRTGKGWLDQKLRNIRRVPRPMQLALRNTFRRKGRLALTLITLTLGGAIFIGTFNVQRSLTSYIDRIGRYFMADVNLTLKQNYRIAEIERLLNEVPGVGAVEGWASAQGELIMPDESKGESVALLAPPAGSSLVEPVLLEGRWIQPGDQERIAVNERFRELFPDLEVGDTVRMNINGDEIDLVVVGFFQMAGRSGGYLAYTTFEYLSNVIHERNRANAFRITADQSGLALEDQEALGRIIEGTLARRGYSVAEITAGHSLTATTADGLNMLTAFLLIMASLIALVGSIGLAGTMSMNILERTREIGIVRAIGASDRAIILQVVVEGLLIGLMSWFFGTLLAIPISSLMSNALNLALFGATAHFTFSPTGVVVWLFAVLILSILASVMPARNAARLTIREVLSYE
jgi:putative ABC transport system permease protein